MIRRSAASSAIKYHKMPHQHTHESGRVVVSDGLGVSVGLQWWVGVDDLVLQRASVF